MANKVIIDPPFSTRDLILEKEIEKLMFTRQTYIEMYTAAFINQTGSAQASGYQLVEKTDGYTTRWWFEKREGM